MSAHAPPSRRPDPDEKSRRIVAAMRTSVAERGTAASTFDHVAQAAGVSRGLLHYYFGSKERLLVEVVRHDARVRMERLEGRLARAESVDEIVAVLVAHLEDLLAQEGDGGAYALLFELFSAARGNPELRGELSALYRQMRGHVAGVLRAKAEAGVVTLRGEPEAVAALLFALGDGVALQILSDPGWDSGSSFETGIRAARFLLGASA